MSNVNTDDYFNQCNIIMMVKEIPITSPTFTCLNELHNLIYKMEWKIFIERVKQKQQVRIVSNNNDDSPPRNLPLEIERPTSDGDIPLFTCLRHK